MLTERNVRTGRPVALRGGRRFVASGLMSTDVSPVVRFCDTVCRGLSAATMALILLAGPASAGPPGAVISNQASLEYRNLAGGTTILNSNEVSVVTGVLRSDATVEFTRIVGAGTWQETVGPSACLQGAAFVNLANPTLLGGTVIDPSLPQELAATTSYNNGESAFIRLVDTDQNVDYQLIDYADVTVTSAGGDSEVVRLTETGLDTGVFAGYIPLASGPINQGDCLLQSAQASSIRVTYTDPADGNDSTSSEAITDPVQRVFESRTGSVVNGASVQLVDAVTGLPATVYGNDGVSQFPSAVTSGGTATDSSGTSYVFDTGEYRFPVVPDGDYRLVVTPPSAYAAPSAASIDELQDLPGAPYQLSPASFGAQFTKSDGVSIAVDIPLDPQSSALFLQKRTLATTAAPGDFVRYELLLENASGPGDATDVRIVDQLPGGVRFVPGSVTIDGEPAADPVVSPDLLTLEFSVPDIGVSGRAQIYYVVEVVGGARGEELVNSATAFAAGGLLSNESRVAIRLTEDLFRSTSTLIGRVLEGDCSQETFGEEQGIGDIRVYLEDGRFAVTDAGGRFHFEGLEPGTHVAQLDTFTVPEYFDLLGCAETGGFAGSAESQFVKLAPGGLHRADFYLRRKEPPVGRIDIEMRNSGTGSAEQVAYDIDLNGVGNVDVQNINLMVVLPAGVSYTAESLFVDEERIGEPHQVGPSVSIPIADQSGNWRKRVRFVADIDPDIDGELVTKAVARFDTPTAAKQRTPLVETRMVREPAIVENEGYVLDLKFAVLSDALSAEDKLQLDTLIQKWHGANDVQISATGHSDSQRISPRNQHRFENNYVLSQARALSAAFYIADALGLESSALQVAGRGPDDPIADNATAEGRRKNRRVDLVITGTRPTQPSFLEVTRASSGTLETETTGAIPGLEKTPSGKTPFDELAGMPASQREPAIESLTPGYAILLPEQGYAPAVASTKISIQHQPGQTVELTLNGSPVSRLNLDSATNNAAGDVAVTRWVGVDLVDGANDIRAVIWSADGSRMKSMRRSIHFSGTPIRAEIDFEKSTLIADGKTTPVIAVRLFDRTDKPARAGIVGNFRVDAPYRSAWDELNDRKNALVEIGNRGCKLSRRRRRYRVPGAGTDDPYGRGDDRNAVRELS